MTQEEKDFLVHTKADIHGWLTSYTPSDKLASLYAHDADIKSYIDAAVLHPDDHTLTELAGIQRFIQHLDAPDVHFDTQSYDQIVAVHSNCPFDTESGRRRFNPTPCQKFQYASIYGFHLSDGSRLYQTAYIVIARKYAKTNQAGIMLLNELINGPANAQAIVCANSEKQAKASFEIFGGQIKALDPNGAAFKVGRTRIEWNATHPKHTDAIAFSVANNADSLDGLHASLVLCDEFAQATSSDTRQVLTTSMKGRKNPLTVIITTLSDKLTGPFFSEYSSLIDILTHRQTDPNPRHPFFIHIFTPDPDDDLYDPHTWKKVHPHYGITVSEDDYLHDLAEARTLGGNAIVAFKTKMLNTWCTESGTEWVSYKKISDLAKPFSLDDLAGTNLEFSLSVDLSDTNDFTSISILGWSPKTKKHYFLTEYYFPRERLESHPNGPLYTRWANLGYLNLIDGEFIDQAVIAQRLIELAEKLKPSAIYYDKYHAHEIKTILAGYGYSDILKAVQQTNAGTTILISYLEKTINLGMAVFPGNPIDAFCFSNVVMDIDTHDNRRMTKRGNNTGSTNKNKIDGAVTCMMCCQAFFDESFKS